MSVRGVPNQPGVSLDVMDWLLVWIARHPCASASLHLLYSSSGVPYARGVIPGVYRNGNVLLQSTRPKQFLIHVIRAQLGNFVTEGGDKSRAASRNRSFLKPMDVEVTAAFKSMF